MAMGATPDCLPPAPKISTSLPKGASTPMPGDHDSFAHLTLGQESKQGAVDTFIEHHTAQKIRQTWAQLLPLGCVVTRKQLSGGPGGNNDQNTFVRYAGNRTSDPPGGDGLGGNRRTGRRCVQRRGIGHRRRGRCPPEDVRRELRRARELTERPFGANVPLFAPGVEDRLQVFIDEGVSVVTVGGGNADPTWAPCSGRASG